MKKTAQLFALLLAFSYTLSAQTDKDSISVDMEEVTIESFFFKQKITSSTSPVGVVTAKDLENIPLQGIGDALKIEPSISMMSDGVWSTAPSIRGLSGQRVIVAVDGNRIETATDISGGMNMINMNDVQQIEIIKSGASSVYGSGAIGGVINFITQPIVYSSTPQFNTAISTSYQSVNNLADEYIRFTSSREKLFLSLSGSFRKADNAQTPAGELANSQFKDFSINGKLGYRINDKQELRIQHQNYQARDVGVPGGASFNAPFTVTFPEHSRTMTDVQYHFSDLSDNLSLLKLKVYNQNINRDVNVITNLPMYKDKPMMLEPTAKHQLWGGLAQADFNFDKQRVSAGIDIWQRQLESDRIRTTSQVDSSITIRGESPLPDASYMSNGLFVRTERQFFNDKLNTTAGLRYDYITVNNEDSFDPEYLIVDGIDVPLDSNQLIVAANTKKMQSWSANLGANFQATDALNIALSGGHSFRAPNIEELYKYINHTSSVEIGNPDLVAEQSNFIDLGIHYNTPRLSFSTNGFINKINNMIAEESGEAYYDNYSSNGEYTSTDTLDAFVLNNIDEALLYGFDAQVKWEAAPELFLMGNIAYTIGENLSTDGYLPQIAPMNGLLGIRYSGIKIVQGEVNYEWAAKQDKLADSESETDGYGLININLNSQKFELGKVSLQAFAGVKNLLDTEYTNHLAVNRGSITVEPGRNFYVKLKISL